MCTRRLVAVAAALWIGLKAGTAIAFPIAVAGTEGFKVLVTSQSPIVATYQGNSAAFSNDLYLMLDASGDPGDDGITGNDLFIFNNHSSAVGSTANLGSFPVGTELIFRLHVRDRGNDFFTGPASRNPDTHTHARVQGNWQPNETLVSFEDLFNGPFDYNDLSFSFTNTGSLTCPDSAGQVDEQYASALIPVGMTPPYTFSIIGGLPSGLQLDTTSGAIAGKPMMAGAVSFTASVLDSLGNQATSMCGIAIAAAPTATSTATDTPTPSQTATGTGAATFTASHSPTDTPEASATVTASPSATLSATLPPTATPSTTSSPSPSVTASPMATATASLVPTATATTVPPPALEVLPFGVHDFGFVSPGSQRNFTYTVRNAGGGTLNGSAEVSCDGFTVSPSTFTLLAGEETHLAVQFAPPAPGHFECALMISSNGGSGDRVLTGAGAAPLPIPVISSPTSTAGLTMVGLLALALGMLVFRRTRHHR